MEGKIVKTTTLDGLILQGFISVPENNFERKACVIHVHGSYGNFYKNFFLDNISSRLSKNGIGFFSIGTRGRDYYSDFKIKKEDGYDSKRIGSINEIFQECRLDIDAWIKYAKELGFNKIILQGHSLGAMKVVYFSNNSDFKLSGIILISPPDIFGFQESNAGYRLHDNLRKAKELKEKDGLLLMPKETYFDIVSAQTYISLFDTPKDTGMFTYSDVNLMRRAGMSKIDCPLLAIFATEHEAIINPIDYCINSIRESISNNADFSYIVIDGANHGYHNKEDRLASVISDWLIKNILLPKR